MELYPAFNEYLRDFELCEEYARHVFTGPRFPDWTEEQRIAAIIDSVEWILGTIEKRRRTALRVNKGAAKQLYQRDLPAVRQRIRDGNLTLREAGAIDTYVGYLSDHLKAIINPEQV